MPRHARLDVTGILQHVMVRGIERRNIFRNTRDRKDLIGRLSFLLPETETACYAWVLMPNHAHFLLKSGPLGIANFMGRLLTGYVVSFNKRHERTGQLFQNRYKSIVCDEETYFKELVRYIHLNPVRGGIVATMEDLDAFPYSGHGALVGAADTPWQDIHYVLRTFSSNNREKAQRSYRAYVETALLQGRRGDLSEGRLVSRLEGWTDVRDADRRVKGDQRILGDIDFVTKTLKQTEDTYERRFMIKSKGYTLDTVIDMIAAMYDVTKDCILAKGRHPQKVEARSLFCYVASHDLGISVTELARLIGMTPSAITYAVERGKHIAEQRRFRLGY